VFYCRWRAGLAENNLGKVDANFFGKGNQFSPKKFGRKKIKKIL